MQDALLIYLMIMNMRHAGGFRFAADLVRDARAQWMAAWIAIARNWEAIVAAIGRSRLIIGNMLVGKIGNGGGIRRRALAAAKFRSVAAIDLGLQSDWLRALTRLENYVVSIR